LAKRWLGLSAQEQGISPVMALHHSAHDIAAMEFDGHFADPGASSSISSCDIGTLKRHLHYFIVERRLSRAFFARWMGVYA
jgi:hypothetical protein